MSAVFIQLLTKAIRLSAAGVDFEVQALDQGEPRVVTSHGWWHHSGGGVNLWLPVVTAKLTTD